MAQVLGDAQKKRVGISVDRTDRWLDECLQAMEAMRQKQQHEGSGAGSERQQQQQQQQQGQDAVAADGAAGQEQQQQVQGQERETEEQPAKRQRREDGGGDGGGNGSSAHCAGAAVQEDGLPFLFAPVVGGSMPEERARSAKAVASKPVAGEVTR